jgi:hypothetical protein
LNSLTWRRLYRHDFLTWPEIMFCVTVSFIPGGITRIVSGRISKSHGTRHKLQCLYETLCSFLRRMEALQTRGRGVRVMAVRASGCVRKSGCGCKQCKVHKGIKKRAEGWGAYRSVSSPSDAMDAHRFCIAPGQRARWFNRETILLL